MALSRSYKYNDDYENPVHLKAIYHKHTDTFTIKRNNEEVTLTSIDLSLFQDMIKSIETGKVLDWCKATDQNKERV